ncbi:MAG: NTPase [Chloroflexi bacterium]|nr:NTPase [Chloroflexota bacterium]MCL5075688.1 NTPase [Chloroflexota bacterium]
MKSAFLITGKPGVGKTSVIKRMVNALGWTAGGFYTEEIRVKGKREGFHIITLNGETAILASIHIHSPFRVSQYGVDMASLENVAVAALRRARRENEVIVIDEIGKMELFSPSFREAVLEALESGKPTLGTITLSPHPWADRIKQHPRVQLIHLTETNRQEVTEQLKHWLQEFFASKDIC